MPTFVTFICKYLVRPGLFSLKQTQSSNNIRNQTLHPERPEQGQQWPSPSSYTSFNPISPAFIVQELCESRDGRPGLSVLTSLLVSMYVKLYRTMLRHWSQLVPNMSTDIWKQHYMPYLTSIHQSSSDDAALQTSLELTKKLKFRLSQ